MNLSNDYLDIATFPKFGTPASLRPLMPHCCGVKDPMPAPLYNDEPGESDGPMSIMSLDIKMPTYLPLWEVIGESQKLKI
jgi:hypothetical protein